MELSQVVHENRVNVDIDSLKVSKGWKRIFHQYEKLPEPKIHWYPQWPRKNIKHLSFLERMDVFGSGWAFIYGPFWYLIQGIWRKGLILLGAFVVILGLFELLAPSISQWVSLGFNGACAAMAKYDYYRKMVKQETFWF